MYPCRKMTHSREIMQAKLNDQQRANLIPQLSSSAAIATKRKPLSLNQTAREDDDHSKRARSFRHLDFYQAESAADIGGK